jgi:TfoX/Sxy family transcriptional regulator of competence genes
MMKWEKAPADLIARFDRLLPPDPNVERRKMFGYPCVFVNGNMAAGLFGSKMFVRLSEAERASLIEKRGASALEPMPGRPMKEYIVIPAGIMTSDEAVRKLMARSLAYTGTLPPKSKKRK